MASEIYVGRVETAKSLARLASGKKGVVIVFLGGNASIIFIFFRELSSNLGLLALPSNAVVTRETSTGVRRRSQPPESRHAMDAFVTRSTDPSKPPPQKKRKQDEEKKKKDMEYEEKRCRLFKQSWLVGEEGKTRDWLKHDSEKNLMFCTHWVKFATNRKAPFVVGSENFKHESIRYHEKSKGHIWSEKCSSNREKKSSDTEAGKALSSLTESQTARLTHLFRTAHALAVQSRPFTDFP